ncbi:MAG TPA: hybrid sensor histidine kinase/response regulator [Desulfobacteraceae bacterium]|nr:hybrid sensor histidine kinase/response regulator [Desulfobacteraceae bacterium]
MSEGLTRMLEQGGLPVCLRQTTHQEGSLLIKDRKRICTGCPVAEACRTSQPLRAQLAHEGKLFGYIAVTADKHLLVDQEEKSLFDELTGDFAYALNVMKDEDTHRKIKDENTKLASQFLQAQKMESVGRLAGGVAHDYNNMLSVIIGFSQLAIARTEPGDQMHDDLQEILDAAMRSADITRQLLAFARKQNIDPKVLDLNDTVEGMLKMLRRLIGEDIDLGWEPGSNLWPVKMDPSQLNQILANLCVNSRDAILDIGKITIETDNARFDEAYCADHDGFTVGEYVLLAVSDDGKGMDREIMDQVFEPFFTTKKSGKGTGLGLSTVYGIVKQNKGFINVYSEPGQGTTIRIYLPREARQPGPAELDIFDEDPIGNGETILVVEDESAILKLAERMLQELGYTVLTASGPTEALARTQEYPQQIHLLITDVVMPDMNGRDLSQKLLHLYPDLRVLFMSGYTANTIAHRGVLEEGVMFIQKPFTKTEMALKVNKALHNRS